MTSIKYIDVLAFAENNCYVKIISVKDAKEKYSLFIDLINKTWTLNKEKIYNIGKSRSFREREYCYGIIGVYNSIEREQRMLMVRDATNAVRFPCVCVD